MDGMIVQRPSQLYIGQIRPFTMDTTEKIALFWQEFFEEYARIKPLLIPPGTAGEHCLGICFPGVDDKHFDYMIAYPMKNDKPATIPADMQVYMLLLQDYVIVPAPGAKENIHKAYQYAFGTWLPQQMDWEHDAGKPDFEFYPPEFNDFKPDSILFIYIPIRRKGLLPTGNV